MHPQGHEHARVSWTRLASVGSTYPAFFSLSHRLSLFLRAAGGTAAAFASLLRCTWHRHPGHGTIHTDGVMSSCTLSGQSTAEVITALLAAGRFSFSHWGMMTFALAVAMVMVMVMVMTMHNVII